MKIRFSDRFVEALRQEYPGLLRDADAVADMVEAIVHQHISTNGRTRATIASWQSVETQPRETADQLPQRVHLQPIAA